MKLWEQYLSKHTSIDVEITSKTSIFTVETLVTLISKTIEENRSGVVRFQFQDSNNQTKYFQLDGPCCNCCDANLFLEISTLDRVLKLSTRSTEEVLKKINQILSA